MNHKQTQIKISYVFFFAICGFLYTQNASAKIHNSQTVPFIGCKSDGQQGPVDAPHGNPQAVPFNEKIAGQLASYNGLLAPRGWHCFETYGSNGSGIYITPQPIGDSLPVKPIDGPGIQLDVINTGTSGRFEAAKVIARVFPAHKSFVDHVIEEDIEPASDFPFGPYPEDKLNYLDDNAVEYITPAQTQGLGVSETHLKPSGVPIKGIAIFNFNDENLILLAVRLPIEQEHLSKYIIRSIETEYRAPRLSQ